MYLAVFHFPPSKRKTNKKQQIWLCQVLKFALCNIIINITLYMYVNLKIKVTLIFFRCTANDLKFVIRLIKHDLRMNTGAKHV